MQISWSILPNDKGDVGSLLEAAISFFLLSLFLLGLDAAQVNALQAAKSSYFYSAALAQLQVMSEQLKLLGDKKYDQALKHWNKQNKIILPQGSGKIEGVYPQFALIITWGDITQCEHNQLGRRGCIKTLINLA